jgi:hypothetical protein
MPSILSTTVAYESRLSVVEMGTAKRCEHKKEGGKKKKKKTKMKGKKF